MAVYAWLKTLQRVFGVSRSAELLDPPGIDVPLAEQRGAAIRERLLVMPRRLLKWMTGLVVYHDYCAILYQRFATGTKARSRVGFRGFSEVAELALLANVPLAMGKPFRDRPERTNGIFDVRHS